MSKALRAGGCLESGYFIQRQKVGGPGESWWMELTTLLQLLKGTGGGSGRDLGKQRKRRRVLVLYGLRAQRIRQSLFSLLPCLCHSTLACGSPCGKQSRKWRSLSPVPAELSPTCALVPSAHPCGAAAVSPLCGRFSVASVT